jgi:hypothetical protein
MLKQEHATLTVSLLVTSDVSVDGKQLKGVCRPVGRDGLGFIWGELTGRPPFLRGIYREDFGGNILKERSDRRIPNFTLQIHKIITEGGTKK